MCEKEHRDESIQTDMMDCCCCYNFMALWIFSGIIWVSQYQKSKTKTNLDFLEQTVSGSGISWAICRYDKSTSL